jgi:hypothetical protein
MGKGSKAKVAQAKQKKNRSNTYWLLVFPITALAIKLIVMFNTQGGGWLGADGENYLTGVDGLLKDGFFSTEGKLIYWPAGYPILIWMLTKISLTYVIALISITQSVFYAYASYYFVKQLLVTRLNPYVRWIAIALAFNPTLSLSSLVVGYESPIAACMLILVGLIVKSRQNPNDRGFIFRVTSAGLVSMLATFMQPRWVLTTVLVALLWALITKGKKAKILILVGMVGIMAIAPAILVERNVKATNRAVISTNLSAALKIGTGLETSGGYNRKGPMIECEIPADQKEVTENQFLICALKWYFSNPMKTLQLTWNKSVYFWSPWSGPLADGTMARNPWLKINPIPQIAKSSQEGYETVYGWFGKVVSWIWLTMSMFLMFFGFEQLWRKGGTEKILAIALAIPILASWSSAIVTIGDHRFRIPTMSLSIVLQVIGFLKLRNRVKNDR